MKKSFFTITTYKYFLQTALFLTFLAVSIPGVAWGTPGLWNPDEVVWRALNALKGELVFDETEPDFNYPSLPKYVMYGVGKILYETGHTEGDVIIAARLVSVVLGALVAILIYQIANLSGLSPQISFLAGMFYIASGIAATNGRFAHNDLYLQFFSTLCVFFSLKYHFSKQRGWIYIAFVCVGMAASSKYTGSSMAAVPLFVLLIMNWNEFRKDWLKSLEILFIGAALCFIGYGIGTPKALLWPAYYFKRAIPAALNFSRYGFNSGAAMGVYGQWAMFRSAVGWFIYVVFMLGSIWAGIKLFLRGKNKNALAEHTAHALLILLFTTIIFDLPFLISINYIPRHFIPFVPFLAVIGAWFAGEIIGAAKKQSWGYAPALVYLILFFGIGYSMLRLTSTALLFMNDARMPATEYIQSLESKEKIIEYTLYPPNVKKENFEKAYNYPIYFVKYATDTVPTGGRYEYNLGEQGLLERKTDYLVIDSLTYSRFFTPSVCETNRVECEFFKKLLANEISTFRLIKEFSYQLPSYLPHFTIAAVNPDVKIYERVK